MGDPDTYPSLSAEDVAQLLGLHAETVRRMARRGELRAFRVAGRMKFCAQDVDRVAFGEPVGPIHREAPRARRRRGSARATGAGSVADLDAIEREVSEGMG